MDITVDWGISGLYVTRLLDRAAMFRGYPHAVRTDKSPEFTSMAFMAWAHSHGIRHILIELCRPMQNGYIESFNSKFRDECLNEQWFETLHQARRATAIWQQDYNEVRPHSGIGRISQAKFAEQHRQRAGDAARSNSATTQIDLPGKLGFPQFSWYGGWGQVKAGNGLCRAHYRNEFRAYLFPVT